MAELRARPPLRILVVTQYFWPEEFRVNDLALELADRGHQVTVLTGQPSFPSRAPFTGYGPFRPWSERLGPVAVKRVPLVSRGRGQGWRLALNYLSFAASASLLGRRPVEAMPRYLSLADALVVTLERRAIYALTIPARLQSFLACGRPVLGALDGEGARVIEESGAGTAVPAEDAGALAAAVRRLYHLPAAERAAMGARGRAYFLEHFERRKLLDELEACMHEIAARRAGRPEPGHPARGRGGVAMSAAGPTPGLRGREPRR